MSDLADDRRWLDRRIYERRLHEVHEFIVSEAGPCKLLGMLITPEGCMKIRNHKDPQIQCKDCPGVITAERRGQERRTGDDRRALEIDPAEGEEAETPAPHSLL